MTHKQSPYNLPEETEYNYINASSHKPYYAPGELSKIANYEKARKDNYKGWHLYHRLELNPDGTTYKTRATLIREGIYYGRPADELIFLTVSEHSSLHIQTHPNRIVNQNTRLKQSNAKLIANDTERRYALVLEAIERGDILCFRDYVFYRRYCTRNGLEIKPCHVDKTSKESTLDFSKPSIESKRDPQHRFLRQVHRYRVIKSVVATGAPIGASDAQFLRRFCFRNGWGLPKFKIDKDKGRVPV